jgi:hypothetical protein
MALLYRLQGSMAAPRGLYRSEAKCRIVRPGSVKSKGSENLEQTGGTGEHRMKESRNRHSEGLNTGILTLGWAFSLAVSRARTIFSARKLCRVMARDREIRRERASRMSARCIDVNTPQ